MLQVHLLGKLEVAVGGRQVEPPASSRAWEVLAWLALHPGPHARGAVAARLWPDVLDSSARASLRSAVWALRRVLGEDGGPALIAGRERLELRCDTDLAAFAALVAGGRYADAVALSRGPLLADLDVDWVLEARDDHAERMAGALARLAGEAGTPEAAVEWARRRLALDPLDERAARELMRHLVQAGDRAGALTVAGRLGDRLRDTLGLAPSAATRDLAREIRAQPEGEPREPVAPAVGDADAGPRLPAPATGTVALVGRDAVLAELVAGWEDVRAGRGAVMLLGGEGGIGKSRLAAELLDRARADGALTASCAALDLGRAPPFGLWAELLGDLARGISPPPVGATWPQDLARIAPALPRRLGRADTPAAEVAPELARTRVFEAAVELVEHAAATRPLVALLEDVHLADAPSLELCAYVARRIAGLPVLLVLTRRLTPRRDAVEALMRAALARGVGTSDHELAPLGRQDVERLVASVARLGAQERDRAVAVADGNPLLALESTRAAARGDAGPPSSLRAVVRAALAPLPAEARRVAELAAVAGRALDRAELAALAAPAAVQAAVDCGLLHSADGRLGYRHALLREAAYAALEDAHRAALHEELAGALGRRNAEAARHLRLAGRDDLAVSRLLRAGEDARRATAFEAAAEFQREAVELAPHDPAPLLALAGTEALLGRREAAMAMLARALERLDVLDAPGRAAAHLDAARWFRSSLCDPAQAGVAARRGLAALMGSEAGHDELRFELLGTRAWSEVTTEGAAAAERTLAEAQALGLDLTHHPLRRHHVDTAHGFVALAEGRLEDAEALLVAAGEAGEAAGRADMAYGGWSSAASVAAAGGGLDRAKAYVERAFAIVAGLPAIELQLLGARASLRSRLGDHAGARDDLDRQAEIAERLGSASLQAIAAHDAGLAALAGGDHERAAEQLAAALDGATALPRAELRLRRAEALAQGGDPDEAEAEIRRAAQESVTPSQRPAALVARMAFAQALVARARGDDRLARRRLDEAARVWNRLAGGTGGYAAEHFASLVDLGRPPVTGVLDPLLELERIAVERARPDPDPARVPDPRSTPCPSSTTP